MNDQNETGLATTNQENKQVSFFQAANLVDGVFPTLENATVMPFDLMADYWTPENKGESKRVFFDRISTRQVADINDSNVIIDLDCAFFFEEVITGTGNKKSSEIKTISNGSKRLVGAIEQMNIQQFTPLLITYQGKKKNRNNSFNSDIWSIKPLKINI